VSRRISSPDFIGRVEESRTLTGALERAHRGDAPTVFVGGEAGIGKSRLLDEFAVTATGAGARVLVGGCAPLGQSPPPLTPIVEALRAHLRSAGPTERTRLAHLAPALTRLLPELAGTQDVWRRLEDLESGQGWVFDLLLGALEALAAQRPLVLVLEDLHWADQSTLDLLALRTQTRRVAGCVVVATYRSDELAAGDPLRLLLAELERSGRIERVELRPFARGELIAQMTGILGARPGRDVVEDVLARSDGNPFFAEELLAAASGAGAGAGSTLQDVLLARIETLPEPTQAVLRILSAARRSLTHQALAAVSGTAERDLESELRRAVAGHVLETTADGAYAFRHALMREAVYATLLPVERVRLHGEIGRAIDAHRAMSGETDPQLLADLGYHWYWAGDQPRAFAAAVEAGLAADDIYAHAEALAQYERVLQLWDCVGAPERRAGMDRVGLRARAAEAASNRGESGRAVRLVEEAIDEADAAADPARAGLLW
jgi:predicted ATPase